MSVFVYCLFLAFTVWIIISMPHAAVSAVKHGVSARIYRNTGTYGTPVWTAVNLVKDVTGGTPWNKTEAGARETTAMLFARTRINLTRSVTIRADDLDAGYQAFLTSSQDKTSVIDMMILDGLISTEGAHGHRAHYGCSNTDNPQEIDGVIYDVFEVSPEWHSSGYPSKVVMGASSTPTFTAF